MTAKQRAAIYEGAAITVAGLLGMFAVPELLNEHDSLAALAAAVLYLGWLVWLAYYVYRMRRI
jgi:heme A synthase